MAPVRCNSPTTCCAHGGVHGLVRSTVADLAQNSGVGTAKAAQVLAAFELGRRTLTSAPGARLRLRTARDAAAYLLPTYGSRPVEQFGIVLLDTKHRVMKTTIVASGSLNATIVQPRDVFREAMVGARPQSSPFTTIRPAIRLRVQRTMELTRRLTAAGILMGIDVVDHVVRRRPLLQFQGGRTTVG